MKAVVVHLPIEVRIVVIVQLAVGSACKSVVVFDRVLVFLRRECGQNCYLSNAAF